MATQQPDNKPGFSLSKLLIGRPLETDALPHQRVTKRVGLAVFASDALSSTAYATEEILIILALAGTGASTLGLSIPIAIAIAVLLAVVTISYRQTIYAYPNGGGAYIVARDNLGELPAQIAGAALLTDYILTVAVSISAGVAQITSGFPDLLPYRVEHCRRRDPAHDRRSTCAASRRAGAIFAVPTYFFLATMFVTLIIGHHPCLTGDLDTVTGVEVVALDVTVADVVPDPARVFERLHGADRHRGDLKRHHGLQGTAQPQRRDHADLDEHHSDRAVPGHHVPGPPDRRLPSETETVISQIGRTIYGEDSIFYIWCWPERRSSC